MNLEELSKVMAERMQKVKAFVEGEDVKEIMGREAVEYYKDSFVNEGFTDETLDPWKDVERRDPKSPWYGHDGFYNKSNMTKADKRNQKKHPGTIGRFSPTRAEDKILKQSGNLKRSIRYEPTATGAKIVSDAPYARVHQFGLDARIYGKKKFKMTPRPFMGKSKVLKKNIEDKIKLEIKKIIE